MAYDWAAWRAARAAEHAAGQRTVWLFDNKMEPVCSLSGFLEGTYSDSCNAPGTLSIKLPGDHPAVDDVLMIDQAVAGNPRALLDQWFWIVVETQNYRVTYRLAEIELVQENGAESVTVLGQGLWEHLNHLPLWASPSLPLMGQLKYADVQAGDSLRVLKSYLFRNLAREFQPGLLAAWDLWSPLTWALLNPGSWPLIVNPVHESTTTEWTVLDSRFNTAGEMFKATLDAAGLLLTVDLWLPGDPQPFPKHTTLSAPTMVMDIKPRAFDTSSTGRLGDVIRGIRATITGDQTTKALVLDDTWFTGQNPSAWCVWSADHMKGITHRLVVKKSTDSRVIVGGRSPQIVNSLIAAASSAMWQGIGAGVGAAFPPLAPFAAAAGAFIGHMQGEMLKDKLFAWVEYPALFRGLAHGPYRYRGIVKPGDGFSLSSLQQGFTALQETQGSVSTEFTVGDGTPYVLGRDFRVGDQAAVVSLGIIFATYVESWTVTVKRGGDDVSLGMGDPRLRESPARALDRSVKTVADAFDRFKTAIP